MCVLESWFSLGDMSVWIFLLGFFKKLTSTETVLRPIVFIVWIFCNLPEPIFHLKVVYFVYLTSKEVSLVIFKICALLLFLSLFFFSFPTGTVFCMLKWFQGKIFALENHSSYICLKSRKAHYCLFHEITQPINQDLNEYQGIAFILSAY